MSSAFPYEGIVVKYINSQDWTGFSKEDREDCGQECRLAVWTAHTKRGLLEDGLTWHCCKMGRAQWVRSNEKHDRRRQVEFDTDKHDTPVLDTIEDGAMLLSGIGALVQSEKEAALAILSFIGELSSRQIIAMGQYTKHEVDSTLAALRNRASKQGLDLLKGAKS